MRDEARGDRFIITVPEAGKLGIPKYLIREVSRERFQTYSERLQFFTEWAYTPEGEPESAIASIKEDLISRYQAAGVDISPESFPRPFLIPEKNREKIKSMLKFLTADTTGVFDEKSFSSIVLFKGPSIGLARMGTIHHELEHGLGRVFSILGEGDFLASQVGYSTISSFGIGRGEALEEGLVSFNTRDFLMHSRNGYITKLRRGVSRRQVLLETIDKGLRGLWSNFFITDRERCSNYMDERAAPPYFEAFKMVGHLIEGVRRKDGDGAVIDFKKELLRGRALPRERFKVINRIDEVFGKGIAKTVFSVSFVEKELIEFDEYLSAVIEKRYS